LNSAVKAGRKPVEVATTTMLNVEFSSRCILRCKWCSLDHDKETVFLDKGVFKRLIDEVIDSGHFSLAEIDLHNAGETLLHPDVAGMLAVIADKRQGSSAFPSVNLLTNAVLLDEAMSQTLIESGALDLVRFSLDGGSPEAFEEIRRGARWPKVSANVRRFLKMNDERGHPVKTGVICVVPPGRPLETGWMHEEFKELISRVDVREIRHPHTWDGSVDLGLSPGESAAGCDAGDRVCGFLVLNLVVLPDARVTVCCADLNARGVIGSLKDASLFELYKSDRRTRMLRLWKEGRKHEVELCKSCTGYY
jgi:Radical SAM superfamily/Iron-sulfur cluster-binding domain